MSAYIQSCFGKKRFQFPFKRKLDNKEFPFYRFDDIFLGIVALKAKIEPLHSEEFYYYKAIYKGPASYRYVLATHGYDNSDEMLQVWNEVRASGYA